MKHPSLNLKQPLTTAAPARRASWGWRLEVGGWMFAALLFVGAGCATYHPEPISPEQSAAQLEGRRLDDPGLKQFLEQNLGHSLTNWPKTNWDLPELTLVAFYFHPIVEVARAEWLVANAGIKTAGARPNPSVNVAPAYDTQIPGNYSPWLVPVTLDWPLETAGKRGKRMAEAEAVAESARWNFVAATWQIRSGVRTSLLDYQVAGQRATLLQQEFATRTEIVKRLQQRFDSGAISRPDLTLAQITLNRTRQDLGDARAQQAGTRSRLAEALGLSQEALEGLTFDADFSTRDANELTSAQARHVALRSRADILAALADYAAAEAGLQLEIARQYPDLHLGPGYAWNSGNAGDNEWSLGLTVDLPILDQNQGPIAEAEARRKLAAAKFIELQSRVIGEIDRGVADFQLAREQVRSGRELIAAEQQQQQSAEAQLHAGAGDPLDLLAAQLEVANAQLSQLDSEMKLQSAFGALEDALQRPADSFNPSLIPVSKDRSNTSSK